MLSSYSWAFVEIELLSSAMVRGFLARGGFGNEELRGGR